MILELDSRLLMSFARRLAATRKEYGLTQQVLADTVGIHVTQLRRYEAGTSQPTVEVLRKLAIALHTSADALLFDPGDRGPSDDLRLQFEAIAEFDPESRKVAKTLLDGLILQHQAKRLAASE